MFSTYVSTILSVATLIAHICIVIYFLLLWLKPALLKGFNSFVARQTLLLSFLVSLAAFVGSILYSEVIGFAPCVLCWIQRVFLFPQVLIFAIALKRNDCKILIYTTALSIVGGIVALYHAYTQLGGVSLTPCTAVGGACSKVFVNQFGYITIPMMALTAFVILILLVVIRRIHERRGR